MFYSNDMRFSCFLYDLLHTFRWESLPDSVQKVINLRIVALEVQDVKQNFFFSSQILCLDLMQKTFV